MSEPRRNLFFYWTGPDFRLIKILRELVFAHSCNGTRYEPILITDQNLNKYIHALPDGFSKLIPPFKADFVRVYLVSKYGGIWIDSDTLIMGDLSGLFSMLEEHDGFFLTEGDQGLCNGVFGSRAGTPWMKRWLQHVTSTIESNKPIPWGELGNYFLTREVMTNKSFFSDYVFINGEQTMYPIHFDAAEEIWLSKTKRFSEIKRPFQPLLVLVNSVYRAVEKDPALLQNTLLGEALQRSYGSLRTGAGH